MLQFLMWTSVAMMVPFFSIVIFVSRSGLTSALVELPIKPLFGCVPYRSDTLGILIIL